MKRILVITFILCVFSLSEGCAAGREKYNFNSDWLLKIGDVPNAQAVGFEDSDWNMVTLPRAFNKNQLPDELLQTQQKPYEHLKLQL